MHSDNQLEISPSAKYRFQLANRQKEKEKEIEDNKKHYQI